MKPNEQENVSQTPDGQELTALADYVEASAGGVVPSPEDIDLGSMRLLQSRIEYFSQVPEGETPEDKAERESDLRLRIGLLESMQARMAGPANASEE